MIMLKFTFENSVFDFSRAKVRKDGRCLDKFDVANVLDHLKPSIPWTIIYDAFSYCELKDTLISYLSAYERPNA